jgi:HTH-type transcriptional regulator/antitoxin HigA
MATETAERWQPNWAVHPGEILAEALEERAMSQAELARRMDRPVKTVNEIVKGRSAITPDTAIQLEFVLGIPSRLWNNLQRDYWEAEARLQELQRLEREAAWVDGFPVNQMIERGWLPPASSKVETMGHLLRFFAVSGPSAWERQWATTQAAFRRSPAFAPSPQAVSAWLRQGEIKAVNIASAQFDVAKLRAALPAIRALVTLDPMAFMQDLVEILAESGVALIMTPELPGTHLSGAARWITPTKALVQLSLRHRSEDQFWFALFHELGHLLRSGPRSAFLDTPGADQLQGPDEDAADRFARNQLISQADFDRIHQAGQFGRDAVERWATELGLTPGIVVGRLQHEGLIHPPQLNYMKRRWDWGDRPRASRSR